MELNIVIKKAVGLDLFNDMSTFFSEPESTIFMCTKTNHAILTYMGSNLLLLRLLAFSNIKWVPETFYGMFLVPALQSSDSGGRRAFFCFNIYKRVYRLPCPFYVLVSYLF